MAHDHPVTITTARFDPEEIEVSTGCTITFSWDGDPIILEVSGPLFEGQTTGVITVLNGRTTKTIASTTPSQTTFQLACYFESKSDTPPPKGRGRDEGTGIRA